MGLNKKKTLLLQNKDNQDKNEIIPHSEEDI